MDQQLLWEKVSSFCSEFEFFITLDILWLFFVAKLFLLTMSAFFFFFSESKL